MNAFVLKFLGFLRRCLRILGNANPFYRRYRKNMSILNGYYRKDPARAYELGMKILQFHKTNATAACAAAWGAWKLGKYEEALRLVDISLRKTSENITYLFIRASSNQNLGKFDAAVEDYLKIVQLNPEHTTTWRNLIRIRKDGFNVDLPRNAITVAEDVADAYRIRNWEQFEVFKKELKKFDPLAADYWQLMQDEFLMKLADAPRDWEKFHQRCLDHKNQSIGYMALCNMFNNLLREGDPDLVMPALSKFRELYDKQCPVSSAPSVCAIMIRERQFGECLRFITEIESGIPDKSEKQNFELKIHQYRLICEDALNKVQKNAPELSANEMSEGLWKKLLESHHERSSAGIIVNAGAQCWEKIRSSSSDLLLDMRYKPEQVEILQKRILDALTNRSPLSLIRLGDSDSYGFASGFPELYTPDVSENTESMWWGKRISPETKQNLIHDFVESIRSADIIGFPGAIRLARDLKVDQRVKLSALQMKYQTLFAGVQKMVEAGEIAANRTWVDEYCNFSLADEGYLHELIEKSVNVVLVTCFKIPFDHLFDHPKIKVVSIPPHTRVASVCESNIAAILPEILEEKKKEVAQNLQPGSLLLVSAGFAGKSFMDIGKKAKAVVIDFGSAIDDIIGHKTRSPELHLQASAAKSEVDENEKSRFRRNMKPDMVIKLEDINNSGRAPLFIKDRQRLATVTSVTFLDENTLACCNFVGRKIYLLRFDRKTNEYQVLDSAFTTYGGETTETDLCDSNQFGHVITSNFYLGTFTQYKREGDRIVFVRDLPFNVGGFVHGVRFYTPDVVAVTVTKGNTGVYFYDLNSFELLLHIKNPVKTQDVTFLDNNRLIMISAHGAPKKKRQGMYHSTIELVEFDLKKKTYDIVNSTIYGHGHFDCTSLYKDRLYLTDQYNNCVEVMDVNNLTVIEDLGGYDFPHGIDIKYNTMAVTNYGTNTIHIHTL